MAILSEMISEDCIRHYSDQGMKIRQIETGFIYEDAVDILPCKYTYEETDEPIETIEDDSEILEILLGDEVNG